MIILTTYYLIYLYEYRLTNSKDYNSNDNVIDVEERYKSSDFGIKIQFFIMEYHHLN